MDTTIKPIFGVNLTTNTKQEEGTLSDFSLFNVDEKVFFEEPPFKETKENFKKHETYRDFSANSYNDEKDISYKGWEKLTIEQNDDTGFSASVYQNEDKTQTVIAFRGTNDDYLDLQSGEDIFKENLPVQYEDAKKTYEKIKEKYPNSEIILTGHSLGGSLAQLVASEYKEAKAYTFNPLGTAEVVDENGLKDNKNVVNYFVSADILSNILPQIGENRIIDKGVLPNEIGLGDFKFGKPTKEDDPHDLKNFKDLGNLKYTDENEIKEDREELNKSALGYKIVLKYVPHVVEIATGIKNIYNGFKDFTLQCKKLFSQD